jgi:conjugal transfer mating pair stabilization protein TraN
LNGVQLCPGDPLTQSLTPSPIAGVPVLAQQIVLTDTDCNFNVGQMDCFIDASGQEQCPYNEGDIQDNCVDYEANPQCGYISSSCVEGALGSNGVCYVTEEIWDCGTDVDAPNIGSQTAYQCAGEVRCMGADCLDPDKTTSDSFARTQAMLNAAQFMTQDMNCTESATSDGGDSNIDIGCAVFDGEPYECKIAVGGVQDCCDVPTNTSVGTYIHALFSMSKLDTSLMALENNSAIKGAYQTLREPIVNTVSEVTKPFTSYAENIGGTVTEFFEPVTTFVDTLKQQIKDAIVDTLNQMFGDTAANMGADAAASAAANQATDQAAQTTGDAIVSNVGAAAGYLMMAYTIYVVAVMVIQMIYECEEQEFELAAKKDTKSCRYVGSYCADEILGACIEKRESYCCYNSPLSRIINEQIRPQIARSFGTAQSPDCGGITIPEVATIDWSMVDLGEWTGMLSHYNIAPDPSTMTIQSLTGAGSDLNAITGTRVDAGARTEQRVNGIDIDEERREAYENTAVDPTGGG